MHIDYLQQRTNHSMQVNKRDLLTQQAGAANSTAEGTSKMLKFSELLNKCLVYPSVESRRVKGGLVYYGECFKLECEEFPGQWQEIQAVYQGNGCKAGYSLCSRKVVLINTRVCGTWVYSYKEGQKRLALDG